jgi:chitinase
LKYLPVSPHFFLSAKTLVVILLSAVLIACGGDSDAPVPPGDINIAPVANASVAPTVNEQVQVTLDGSNSSDSDGIIASYFWRQTKGISVALSNEDTAYATFTAPATNADENLTFNLTVTDNDGVEATATISVNITDLNNVPIANAGPDQTINELTQETVTLNGIASDDSDGSFIRYSWTQTSGTPIVTLSDDTAVSPMFSTKEITTDSILTFELTVTDTDEVSASDVVVVSIRNFTARLNDTGLTWGGEALDGNNTDCTGSTIDSQDCSHGRDALNNDDSDGHGGFSFTKLDANGAALAAAAVSWSCVRDNVTGLVWEVKTDNGGIHDKDKSYSWGGVGADQYATIFYDDWDVLVNDSNTATLCGFDDWRVPQIDELVSIVNLNQTSPAIDTDYFPNTPSRSYWSSSASARDTRYARSVSFSNGYTGNGNHRSLKTLHVRLLRGQ